MGEPEAEGYGNVARLLHWVTAALVLVMIPVGVSMTSAGFESVRDPLYILHKGLGSVLLLIVGARVLWRLGRRGPAPLPQTVPTVQRRLAEANHGLLYVLLVVMPVSGYVRTVGGGFPVEMLDALGIPPLVPEMPGLARAMAVVHKVGAYTLTALIALHVGAVLHHALVEGDGVMARMWPPMRQRGRT